MKCIEVRLEELFIETLPHLMEGDPSGGKLANLVVSVLKETDPDHSPYPDECICPNE
ncbi:hypothetical protein LCGC14_3127550 [marine sediment metagenome]|uniref:Uncharacterized protein n=1 Tax=marine sediment metagenome TaxID=412755 RepID=A0A0F8Y7Q3_9ZZZZ